MLSVIVADDLAEEDEQSEEGLLSSSDRSLFAKSDSSSNSISFQASTSPNKQKKKQVAFEAKVQHYQDDSWALMKKEVRILVKNKDYLILFVVFSIGVGFFNAILTLLNQLIEPFGYR